MLLNYIESWEQDEIYDGYNYIGKINKSKKTKKKTEEEIELQNEIKALIEFEENETDKKIEKLIESKQDIRLLNQKQIDEVTDADKQTNREKAFVENNYLYGIFN
jgi:hypothetical protein